MWPGLARPIDPPGAGRGLGLSAGRTRAVALPLLPSGSRSSGRPALPFPNATGPARGVAAGRAGGHSPGWSRFLGTPRCQRGSLPAACPQRCPGGLFSAGLGRAPKGPGSHQCPAFSLVRRSPAAGSPDPRSHCHGNSPRPWEKLPGLSFPPRKQGGREAEETSGSLLPNRGHRHDARAMGTAGGVSGPANISAAQLPAPTGAPQAPWGSLPFPGGAGTPPQCCPPAGSPGRTAGHSGSHSVREERPTATSCHSPRLPGPPVRGHCCATGAAERELSASPRGVSAGASTAPGIPAGTRQQKDRAQEPIDWGQLGTVPSAPTSATRQLPPSQLRGHRGWGEPCLERASPSSHRNGTHWDWHRVHCLLHPQIPGEAAQFSAHIGRTGFQKGVGNLALPTMPGDVLCLSFPVYNRPTGTGSDPATSTLSWARSSAVKLPS